jgi:GGDEF domain-containing protein
MVVSTGEAVSWLVALLSAVLFVAVHFQFWYEESEQGRRLHHAIERMRGRIYEDNSTGLPNSRHFVFELRRQMMRSNRSGKGFSLILSDIRGAGGGTVAEHEIPPLAPRAFRSALGEGDFVARLQGSVFAAIVLDDGERTAAEKARDLVPALGSTIPVAKAANLHPIVSITGYQGELEVRDFLGRAQRDLHEMRARGPLHPEQQRTLLTGS